MAAVWMLLCVLTVCLARELSPNEISLKKAFALFQAMESCWSETLAKVSSKGQKDNILLHTHKVDEPLNGTMSDEEKLNGTMSDEQFNGTMSDEAKFNGTMSDEAKFNGTMSVEAKFNGTMSARQSSTGR
ncbi:hypothetical protein F7725_013836 [Dissostichus mawsoni]|uniref:Uncharacterized protein n=1 Tax=Dissostichus mawsoni TaxID=36200 RepID=A0A7J5YYG3_DISMA|nr:hypothetical protein F7725_013836 [Dissostichus mawsoni]